MARPELGTKRTCPTTGRKFYDMNRDPIVSPYSGESYSRDSFEPQTARSRAAAAAAAAVVDDEDELEPDVAAAGPEVVSLETVSEAEEAGAEGADEAVNEDEAATEDTFLEDEEEGGDVSDLVDSDIEDDEES